MRIVAEPWNSSQWVIHDIVSFSRAKHIWENVYELNIYRNVIGGSFIDVCSDVCDLNVG